MGISNRITYGIEIEAENLFFRNRVNIVNGWSITDDGSLRNGGLEFVSPVFHSKYQAKRHILLMLKALKENNANFSYRCGIHVHAGTFKEQDVMDLIKAYLQYERMLFELFPSRVNNNFCVPLLESDGRFACDLGKAFLNEDARRLFYTWHKYFALNILPIESQGTIEFRMLEATYDREKLYQAIDIIESIVKVAKGEEPIVKPKPEHVEESKEFLAMCKHIAQEDNYTPITRLRVERLFGLSSSEEDDELDRIVEDVYNEIMGENA